MLTSPLQYMCVCVQRNIERFYSDYKRCYSIIKFSSLKKLFFFHNIEIIIRFTSDVDHSSVHRSFVSPTCTIIFLLEIYCMHFLFLATDSWSFLISKCNFFSIILFWSISVEFCSKIFLMSFLLRFAPDNFHVSRWNSENVFVFSQVHISQCVYTDKQLQPKYYVVCINFKWSWTDSFACYPKKKSVLINAQTHKHFTLNLLKCWACSGKRGDN